MADERRKGMRELEIQMGRFDERLKAVEQKIDSGNETILNEIRELKDNFSIRLERAETTKLAASDFISYKTEQATVIADKIGREEFEPIKKIVYGIVATILLAAIAAILKLIFI